MTPVWMPLTTVSAVEMFLVQTAPPSPYSVWLPSAIASSTVSNGMTERTGPKISSCAILMLLSTFEKIVGLTK